ncbi:MAG: hypothetical protein M1820_005567 [Bogoriella megaspora]|nr:MAG: hypothetical protein M1820_005567 [Bogoriella megaspora]
MATLATMILYPSLSIILLYILQWAFRYLQHIRFARRYGCGPPVKFPHKDPLGLDLFLQTGTQMKEHARLRGIQELYSSYGNTFQTNSFGSKVINTIDPANIQAFLSLNFDKYGLEPIRFPVASPIMGRSIFTSDGPFWDKARHEVKPIFSHGEIANMANFERHINHMMEQVPLDGSLFDIAPLIDDLFLTASLDYLFAQSIIFPNIDHSSLNARFLRAFRAATAGAGRRHFRGKLRNFIPDRLFNEACRELHEIADMHVEAALGHIKQDPPEASASTLDRSAFLLDLARQTEDRVYLRNQLLAVFMAGHESTAVLVEDAIFEMVRHPEVWSRARVEAENLSGKSLTFESVRSQGYMYQIIKEVLRLHPLSPTSSRVALAPTVLPNGGKGNRPLCIAPGTTVLVHRHALHLSKELYGSDAEEFRPERWDKLRQGWHYMPFSGGPRTCPAQTMAMAEAAAVLSKLLQMVQTASGEGEWRESWGLIVKNTAGVWVRLRRS